MCVMCWGGGGPDFLGGGGEGGGPLFVWTEMEVVRTTDSETLTVDKSREQGGKEETKRDLTRAVVLLLHGMI